MPTTVKGPARWSPLPQGWAKLNIDASFDVPSCFTTFGVVARNCRGEVLMAGEVPSGVVP